MGTDRREFLKGFGALGFLLGTRFTLGAIQGPNASSRALLEFRASFPIGLTVNGRYYSKAVLKRAVDVVGGRTLFGYFGSNDPKLAEVSHTISDLQVVDRDVTFLVSVLDTPRGRALYTELQRGGSVGRKAMFTQRGSGTVTVRMHGQSYGTDVERSGVNEVVVDDGYVLDGVDVSFH